jgi:hypothetical protein
MPSATPIPRGPAHLALFGADDLLDPGACPVCRYAAEADDRFLGWFALEGHAEAETITRLCASLGMCPAHTRRLLGQPGAEGRLTAAYRYVLRAAVSYLADRTAPKAPCPACSGGTEATSRAVDTLLTGLQEDEPFRDRYRGAAGLCVPHLRLAAAHGPRRQVAWLAAEARVRLAAGPPSLAAIAGEPDADTDMRTWLRAALPASGPTLSLSLAPATSTGEPGRVGECPVCLPAAQAERDALAQLGDLAGGARAPGRSWPGPCPAHLREACADLTGGGQRLLEMQLEQCDAWLAGLSSAAGLRAAVRLRSRLRGSSPGYGTGHPAACPACEAWSATASSASEQLLRALATGTAAHPDHPEGRPAHGPAAARRPRAPRLCLRHVLALRQRDPRAAGPAVRAAASAAESLVAELEEAFRKRTWTHRQEERGREMTAWRRAAAFIDGRVYGGGPPRALRA